MAEIERELVKGSVSARVNVPENSLNVNTIDPANATGNNFASSAKLGTIGDNE